MAAPAVTEPVNWTVLARLRLTSLNSAAVKVVSAGPVMVKSDGVPEVLAEGAIVKGEDVPVMVVLPFREIAPVPVEKVPVPEIAKLPDAWVYPVIPDNAPALDTSKFVESITKGADPPPKVTVPVEVPVFILVAKFEEALRDIVPPVEVSAPETVSPPDAVSKPVLVSVPLLVVVIPVLPIEIAEVLAVPIDIVPAVPEVTDPVSKVNAPELPETEPPAPDMIEIAPPAPVEPP